MRVTAADLDERRILAPARRLIERLPVGYAAQMAKVPVAAGGARGSPDISRHAAPNAAKRKAKRPRAPLERDIQREILAFLNAQPGICAWKAGAGLIPTSDGRRVRMGKAGVSDVIGWIRCHLALDAAGMPEIERCHRVGRRECFFPRHISAFIAVEVKRPGGKPTPAQLDYLARLKDAGSPLAMVATSVDEVRRAVEAL